MHSKGDAVGNTVACATAAPYRRLVTDCGDSFDFPPTAPTFRDDQSLDCAPEHIMSEAEMRILKRKRTTERTNASRFITAIKDSTDYTPLDDYEHYRGRLQEMLDQLVRLNDAVQDLLEDHEYTVDVGTCEEYIDSAKRALLKAN